MTQKDRRRFLRGPISDTSKLVIGERWRNAKEVYHAEQSEIETTCTSGASKTKSQGASQYANAIKELSNNPNGIRLFASQFARTFLFQYITYDLLASGMAYPNWVAVADLDSGSFIFLILTAALEELGTMLSYPLFPSPETVSASLTEEIMAILDKSYGAIWGDEPFNPSSPTYVEAYKSYLISLEQGLTHHVSTLAQGELPPVEIEVLETARTRLLERLLDSTQSRPFPLFCNAMVTALRVHLGDIGPIFDYFAHIVDPFYGLFGASSGARHHRKLQDGSESIIRVLSRRTALPFTNRTFIMKFIDFVYTHFTPLVDIFALKALPSVQTTNPVDAPQGFEAAVESWITDRYSIRPGWVDWGSLSTNPTPKLVASYFIWASFRQTSRSIFQPNNWDSRSIPRAIKQFAKSITEVVHGRRERHEFVVTFDETLEAREALAALPSYLADDPDEPPLRYLDFVLPPAKENRRNLEHAMAWDHVEGPLANMGIYLSELVEVFEQKTHPAGGERTAEREKIVRAAYLRTLRHWRVFVDRVRDTCSRVVKGGCDNPYRGDYHLPRQQRKWLEDMGETLEGPSKASETPTAQLADLATANLRDEQAVELMVTLSPTRDSYSPIKDEEIDVLGGMETEAGGGGRNAAPKSEVDEVDADGRAMVGRALVGNSVVGVKRQFSAGDDDKSIQGLKVSHN